MPFDAAPDQSIESAIIDEMIRILGPNGENWTKGSGGFENLHCMLHAMSVARHRVGANADETELQIVEAIARIYRRYSYIPYFNDAPVRTFADVLKVLQHAKTTRPSAALRRVVAEFKANPQLVSPPQWASIYDDKMREQRRNAIAETMGTVASVLIMLAGVCIP